MYFVGRHRDHEKAAPVTGACPDRADHERGYRIGAHVHGSGRGRSSGQLHDPENTQERGEEQQEGRNRQEREEDLLGHEEVAGCRPENGFELIDSGHIWLQGFWG